MEVIKMEMININEIKKILKEQKVEWLKIARTKNKKFVNIAFNDSDDGIYLVNTLTENFIVSTVERCCTGVWNDQNTKEKDKLTDNEVDDFIISVTIEKIR